MEAFYGLFGTRSSAIRVTYVRIGRVKKDGYHVNIGFVEFHTLHPLPHISTHFKTQRLGQKAVTLRTERRFQKQFLIGISQRFLPKFLAGDKTALAV